MALRRFTDHKPPGNPLILALDHPAVREGTTLYRARRVDAGTPDRLLKRGMHSRKIGDKVMKGRLRGAPIYTLTLEERATCPTTCAQWRSCYGNKMNWASRIEHGAPLVHRLRGELAALNQKHPKGFLVRLHVLGDFYNLPYVAAWALWLQHFPALHVFGYTAWPRTTPIGAAIANLAETSWDRFAVRTSNRGGPRGTVTVKTGATPPDDAIVCPAQTERTECCATCALCWATQRQIAFLEH